MSKIVASLLAVIILLCANISMSKGESSMNEQFDMIRNPVSRDVEAMKVMGLIENDGLTQSYIEMHDFYVAATLTYLEEKGELLAIDGALLTQDIGFIPGEHIKAFGQLDSSYNLQFFSLISPIPLERLTEEQIHELGELASTAAPDSERAQKFVVSTLDNIFTATFSEESDMLMGWSSNGNHAPNKSIVLVLSTDCAWDENGNMIDPEMEEKKVGVLKELIPDFEEQISKGINFPVTIFLEE